MKNITIRYPHFEPYGTPRHLPFRGERIASYPPYTDSHRELTLTYSLSCFVAAFEAIATFWEKASHVKASLSPRCRRQRFRSVTLQARVIVFPLLCNLNVKFFLGKYYNCTVRIISTWSRALLKTAAIIPLRQDVSPTSIAIDPFLFWQMSNDGIIL